MNHYTSTPFLRFLLPFIAGILLYRGFPFPAAVLPFLITVCCCGVFIFLGPARIFARYQLRWLFGASLSLLLAASGFLLSDVQADRTVPPDLSSADHFIAMLTEERVEKTKSTRAELKLKSIYVQGHYVEADGGLIAYFSKDSLAPEMGYGDLLVISSRIQLLKDAANPRQFSYKNYLGQQGIYYQSYVKPGEYRLLATETQKDLMHYVIAARTRMLGILKEVSRGEKEHAMAAALILGYKEDLDAATKASFSNVGAIHILAVSGLHVAVIFIMISKLLFFLRKKSWQLVLKFLVILFVLWFYALLSGFSPSVLRATVMFSFMLPATIWKMPSNIYNTMALSAFVLLLTDTSMLYDVGFELSYFAVIGIVYVYPKMQYWFVSRFWLLRQVWSLVAISIAATLSTLPMTLYYFGQFPTSFILSNLAVVPLSGLVLYEGIAVLIFSFLPFLPDLLGWLLHYTIVVMNGCVAIVEQIPYSNASNMHTTLFQALLLYLLIIAGLRFSENRKPVLIKLSLAGTIVMAGSMIWRQYGLLQQRELVCYHLHKTSYAEMIDGKKAFIISEREITDQEYFMAIKPYHRYKGLERPHLMPPDKKIVREDRFYALGNKRIGMIDSTYVQGQASKKLKLDYLLVSAFPALDPVGLKDEFDCGMVIFDGSNPSWKVDAWIDSCKAAGMPCHSTHQSGAYIAKL